MVAEAVPELQEVQRVVFSACGFRVNVVNWDPSVLSPPFAHPSEEPTSTWYRGVKKKLHWDAIVGRTGILVVKKPSVQKSPEKRNVDV